MKTVIKILYSFALLLLFSGTALASVHATGDNYDLKYHRLELEINPSVRHIKGCITSYMVIQPGSTEISFDLINALWVDSVVYHENRTTFSHTNNQLSINIPAINTTLPDSVKVYYHGIPGNGVISGTNVFYTDSEPFKSSSWWPCKMILTDKIDSLDFIITHPTPYRAAANGELITEVTTSGNTVAHWQHRYPCVYYAIALAVSNFYVYTQEISLPSGGQLTYLNYMYNSQVATKTVAIDALVPIIQYFDSLLCPYPFKREKYGHVEAAMIGMENQTMSFVYTFNLDLTVHELAHQWFGDKVTCETWEDIWLNEGFASYMETISKERFNSHAIAGNQRLLYIQECLNNATSSVLAHPLYPFGTNDVYYKGAIVLHMLRQQIGDEAFFAALTNYLNDPALAYGNANRTQLKQHMESTSGKNLTAFFNEWVENCGFPILNVKWHQESINQLYLSVSQVQPACQSNSFTFYHNLPIHIRLAGANGDQKDTTLYATQTTEYFYINPGFTVSAIIFDPHSHVLAQYNLSEDPTLSIKAEHNDYKIKVYPVPATDVLYFSSEVILDRYELLTQQGVAVSSGIIQSKNGYTELPGISAGIYILTLYPADGVPVRVKAIVQ